MYVLENQYDRYFGLYPTALGRNRPTNPSISMFKVYEPYTLPAYYSSKLGFPLCIILVLKLSSKYSSNIGPGYAHLALSVSKSWIQVQLQALHNMLCPSISLSPRTAPISVMAMLYQPSPAPSPGPKFGTKLGSPYLCIQALLSARLLARPWLRPNRHRCV